MLPVEEALAKVGETIRDLVRGTETVSVDEALGRVLAEDVRLDHDVPPFRRSAMDGYAVRAADAVPGVRLRIVGRTAAGDAPGGRVSVGDGWWINTGAPVPDGTDRVLPVEWTREEEGTVRVERLGGDAPHVIEAGEHARAGDVVQSVGTRIGPGSVSVLATAGRGELQVFRRPRVAVLGTGTELVALHELPGPGRIRNSNGPMLRAQVRRAGATAHDLGVVGDDLGRLRAAIRQGLAEADVVLLSGGVSQGDLDLVPDALEAEGVERVFHRWAVQPGGPLWFGARDGRLVFGLPGNPAATFVGFELLVVPALRRLAGLAFAPRRTLSARYEGAWGRAADRQRYRPVRLEKDADGALVAIALPWLGSGDPQGPARMGALAVLPAGRPQPVGAEKVEVVVLEDLS